MNTRVIVGVGLLVLAAVIIVAVTQLSEEPEPEPEPDTVVGFYGGEKEAFLENERVRSILRERYDLELDIRREGSIEMVSFPASQYDGVDFVWPSNEIAEVIFSDRTDLGVDVSSETIFRSPIVMYSWQEVVDALTAEGIVEQIDATYFVVDTPRLIEMVLGGTQWSDIGLNELGERSIRVISTDPTQSNSGNMFYGLLLNLLSDNEIAQQSDLETHLPTIIDYYERQGRMSDSSGSLFEDYLLQGLGANPLIVGYENQLIEVYLLTPELRDQLTTRTRVLYPRPTVWSSHPLLALTDTGERLMEALQDEDIQRIAWEDHGFRSDIPGITNPDTLDFEGIPEQILNVLNLPRPAVMEAMLEALRAVE